MFFIQMKMFRHLNLDINNIIKFITELNISIQPKYLQNNSTNFANNLIDIYVNIPEFFAIFINNFLKLTQICDTYDDFVYKMSRNN